MKIIANLAVTLDGFICKKDGSVDYLDKYNNIPNKDFDQFIKSMDLIIMGKNAYLQILEWSIPWKKDIIVLSETPLNKANEFVNFFNGDIKDLIKKIQNKYNLVWAFGGAHSILDLLENNLINEFHFSEINEKLGQGIYLITREKLISKYNFKLTEQKEIANNLTTYFYKSS